jgi:VWFA-related protein
LSCAAAKLATNLPHWSQMRTTMLFLFAAGILAAQASSPAATENADAVIRESFKFVLVRVAVTNTSGHVVNGLQPDNFRLTDNGSPQTITADVALHPLSVVVAIQTTSRVARILPDIRKLGYGLSTMVLGDSGELALVGFDTHVRTLTDFTSDPDKIDATLKALKFADGAGNVSDAAMAGMNLLRDRPANRQLVLILINEGRAQGSMTEVREVLTAAEFGNVIIYSLNVSPFVDSLTSPTEQPRANSLDLEGRPMINGAVQTPTTDLQMQLGNWTPLFKAGFFSTKSLFVPSPLAIFTRHTGGREFSFHNQKPLDDALADIGAELHGQYLLTYMPSTQHQAGFHEVLVTVQQPGLTVRTRDGYWLAAKPE